MQLLNNKIYFTIIGFFTCSSLLLSCKKDGNPNNLPPVSTADYVGKIDGFNSSDEVFPESLVAYWPFDNSKNEVKSNTAPGTSLNDSYIATGIKGQALRLNAGFLYYPTQFNAFKTEAFKSFAISTWIQISNNGSKRTMLFQLTRPGVFNGSLNFSLNTQSFPASNTTDLKVQPTFITIGGGTQDNINTLRDAPGAPNYMPYITPPIGPDKWVHLALNYNASNGFFDIWINGLKAGAFPSRGTGNNNFRAAEPSEVIIGGNYNVIPGKTVSTDVSFGAMTGVIDEMRIYNIALPDAHIKALYNLGKAGK